MKQAAKVAVVRSDSRSDAVGRALALIADDLRPLVHSEVLIKPNLVSHKFQLPSTHADTLAQALDAVFAAGARRVTVAEGATDASAGFRRFGFHDLVQGRRVRFFDINRDETEWDSLALSGVDGGATRRAGRAP